MMVSFCMMLLVTAAALSVVSSGEGRVHSTSRTLFDVQGTELCEGGTQNLVLGLWIPFKTNQSFDAMDTALSAASETAPAGAVTGTLDGNLSYASAVIAYNQVDSYTRTMTVRTVGWQDLNGNGVLDPGEPEKIVDVTYTFELSRSEVFDYAYFVNNYGWMDGFGPNDLVCNGDMRANGNFSITNGSPTINGSVFAAQNNDLVPGSAGVINAPPVKWTNAQYASRSSLWGSPWLPTTKTGGDRPTTPRPTARTARPSTCKTRLRCSTRAGQIINNTLTGTALGDVTGLRSWTSSSPGVSTTTQLSSAPMQQVVMPDLNNVGSPSDAPNANGSYCAQSQAYTDPKQTFQDGSTNPLYGQLPPTSRSGTLP